MENPVLTSARAVIQSAQLVCIDEEVIRGLASQWLASSLIMPTWPQSLHFASHEERRLLDYLIILDSLNFCFWSATPWHIRHDGQSYRGYMAFALRLKECFEQFPEQFTFQALATISLADFSHYWKGQGTLPLLLERWRVAQAVSRVMVRHYEGDTRRLLEAADQRAEQLLRLVYQTLPYFGDSSLYQQQTVYFLKRAQILIGDIWGAFQGQNWGNFSDISYLTAFADYRIPQILHSFGILVYHPQLARNLKEEKLIPQGSTAEVEIRSAAVWGVELLRRELETMGHRLLPLQLDWWLWNQSHKQTMRLPHHRTLTIWY